MLGFIAALLFAALAGILWRARHQIQTLTAAHAAHLAEATDSLRESNVLLTGASQRFETLFQSLPTACLCCDSLGHILEWNAACEELYGLPAGAVLLRPVGEVGIRPEDRERARTLHKRLLAGEAVGGEEWELIRPDGATRHVLLSTFPLRGPNGDVVGGLRSLVDVTRQKQAEEMLAAKMAELEDFNVVLQFQQAEMAEANVRLESLATRDGMTGLKNHRAFQERLADEFSRARRYGMEFSVLMLDVDRFKQYNDAFGHPAGDDVLKAVADLLVASARDCDFVARYGGEEFAILLPHTDRAGAARFGERVREAVGAAAWPRREITLSIGVAAISAATLDASHLLSAADTALYASKTGGRNRVTTAPAEPALPAEPSFPAELPEAVCG